MPMDTATNNESRVLENSPKDGGISNKLLNEFMADRQFPNSLCDRNKQAMSGEEAKEKIQELSKKVCGVLGFGDCELTDSQDKKETKQGPNALLDDLRAKLKH